MGQKHKIMNVYYCFTKLTKKAIRKKELAIYFENDSTWTGTKQRYISRLNIIHIRKQTKKEEIDGDGSSRQFCKWSYFIDDKPWNGNIDKVLESNFLADKNNVCAKERQVIREKLHTAYYEFYNLPKKKTGQQVIIFN